MKVLQAKAAEAKPTEAKVAEAKAAEAKAAEIKAADAKAAEAKDILFKLQIISPWLNLPMPSTPRISLQVPIHCHLYQWLVWEVRALHPQI